MWRQSLRKQLEAAVNGALSVFFTVAEAHSSISLRGRCYHSGFLTLGVLALSSHHCVNQLCQSPDRLPPPPPPHLPTTAVRLGGGAGGGSPR